MKTCRIWSLAAFSALVGLSCITYAQDRPKQTPSMRPENVYDIMRKHPEGMHIYLTVSGQSPNSETCYTVDLNVGKPKGKFSTGSSHLNIGATVSQTNGLQILDFLAEHEWLSRMDPDSEEYDKHLKSLRDTQLSLGFFLNITTNSGRSIIFQKTYSRPGGEAMIQFVESLRDVVDRPAKEVLNLFLESARIQHNYWTSTRKQIEQPGGAATQESARSAAP